MRRSKILHTVALVTGLPERFVKRWWWSLDRRERGRALGWLRRVASGALDLRIAWEEWIWTDPSAARKTLEPRERVLGMHVHKSVGAPVSPRLRIVGPISVRA